MILWSIRTFWYEGSAETRENDKFGKGLYLSKIAAQTRRLIFGKVGTGVLGIEDVILVRYDMVLNI